MLAFACEPDEGSEPEIGWKWAWTMAQSCEVTVVTQTKNRPRIEEWEKRNPESAGAVRFSYVELGPLWRKAKKRAPGGMYLYYAAWQWKLRSHVKDLLGHTPIDLLHHVTFASFRMPVWAGGRPIVWGPVGGAECAPLHLLTGHGTFAGQLRERIRNLATRVAVNLLWLWEPTTRNGGLALASTPATAEALRRNGIITETMPTIGYDLDDAEVVERTAAPDGPLRLIFVGRLHLLKGLHLAIAAMAQLKPDVATLTIVGDGPERERLRELIKELGLQNSVTLAGFVPRQELGEWFARHDTVLAPSLYESGGLSVLEGFARGLPAIVLNCGGHALSVADDCGVKIIPTQTQERVIDDLAAAIRRYANDRDLCRENGESARQWLESRYGWAGKHRAMVAVYRKVIEQTDFGSVSNPSSPVILSDPFPAPIQQRRT